MDGDCFTRPRREARKGATGMRCCQTIGGVLGTVTQVNEKEVTVKVDETNNVKIKFTRGAVHRVLDDEKTETK